MQDKKLSFKARNHFYDVFINMMTFGIPNLPVFFIIIFIETIQLFSFCYTLNASFHQDYETATFFSNLFKYFRVFF